MKKLNVDYYDVKNKLPIIGEIVSVFFENKAYSGHGIWLKGIRVSDTTFKLNELIVKIDKTDRSESGIGVTHWSYLESNHLPNLCRLHNGNCF